MTFDTLIHNAVLLTCNAGFEIRHGGWVGVSGGKIQALGTGPVSGRTDAREYLDARGGIVMPGLVNTHTHLPMTLFRGLADDLPLKSWLEEHIFPAERAVIAPESVLWAALLACAEMALSGTTTCCDGYFFEDSVAEAVEASGLRAVLGQGIIDHPAPGVPDPAGNLAAARRFCRRWQARAKTIRASVFCHSPYTCSMETLVGAKRLCEEFGLLFQIHAAETRWEIEHLRATRGATPVRLLERAGLLDERTLLAHGIWVDAEDIAAIAGNGAKVSHNPESNMKLASGVAPVVEMQAAGITVGIGTDGCASNNDLDLFQTMDTAAKLHKVMRRDPTALPAETVVRMATIDGARALGLEAEIGSIEPGKQADLILIDTRKPHLTPMHHPASAVVYAAKGSDVQTVMVAGRLVVRNRRVLTIDIEEVMERVALTGRVLRHRAANPDPAWRGAAMAGDLKRKT
jgi:5-methylthioadenosine/S-adenosylhomocysteine deaminase